MEKFDIDRIVEETKRLDKLGYLSTNSFGAIRFKYFDCKAKGEAEVTYFLTNLASSNPEMLLRIHTFAAQDLIPGIVYFNKFKDEPSYKDAVRFVAEDLHERGFGKPLEELVSRGMTDKPKYWQVRNSPEVKRSADTGWFD